MRNQITALAALLLAACASAPAPLPAATTEPPRSDAAPASRALRQLAAAGRPNAPTRAEVERVFGAADIARQEGAGAALTYRYQDCALLLLFTADNRNDMRLAEAMPGPRRNGAPAPSLEQCAAEAEAR